MLPGYASIYYLLHIQGTYSSKADCWSMGVIAYILLSQKKPFASKTRAQTKAKIMKCQYNFDAEEWKSISAVAKDFVSSLIVFEPTDRLSAKQAVEHSWLKNNAAANTETSAEFKRQNSLMKHVHDRILGYGSMSELRRIASVVVAHKSSTGINTSPILQVCLILSLTLLHYSIMLQLKYSTSEKLSRTLTKRRMVLYPLMNSKLRSLSSITPKKK